MNAEAWRKKQQTEVDVNYEVFLAKLPELLRRHPGQYALMKNLDFKGFFDTRADAIKFGKMQFDDGVFSVHEITDEVVDLGVYSWV